MPWAERRYDPNGYYRALGLDPDKPAMMEDIRKAYRQRVRELHPDMGGDDIAAYRKVVQAYKVLSDPFTRRQYDILGEDDVWADEETREELMHKLLEHGVSPDDEEFTNVVNKFDQEMQSRVKPPSPFKEYQVWYYVDDEYPTDNQVPWLSTFGDAYWTLGLRNERVEMLWGEQYAVQAMTWGLLFEVPRGSEANPFMAIHLAARGVDLLRYPE